MKKTIVIGILSLGWAGSALAIEPKDIYGKWCTDAYVNGVHRQPLIITKDKYTRMGADTTCVTVACAEKQMISDATYEVDGDTIVVHWKWKNRDGITIFKLESSNLLQLPSTSLDSKTTVDLLAYHRCR